MSHWRERCRRLATMSPDELFVRTRQEFAKRYDLLLARLNIHLIKDDVAARPFSNAFFFSREDVPCILDFLREQLPEVSADIVLRAEQICKHRFNLLGYRDVDYGQEIDWHADAVHGRRSSMDAWFRIPYLDFDRVGDVKIIWELNRQQHLTILAKAYRLTGDARFGHELFQQWYHWQKENPYPFGINWASSLEIAFRSLSWLWVWYLLDGCSIVPSTFSFDLRRALMINARHMERFLSTYFSPNTHLLGEAVGLFFIGTLLLGSPSAQRWQNLGWKIILQEARRQVQPDGMHFEQSIYYHTYALDFFLHSRLLASVSGIPVPDAFDRTIEKMLDVIGAFGTMGRLPQFGDDDGGRVFDPTRNRSEHLLDPLATGAVLFGRSDFKKAADHIREETVWLLGAPGVRRFHELHGQTPTLKSFALQSSGFYVMCGSNPVPYQLVIDAGPHGTGLAGHGHGDALSIQLAVNGEQLLIDPGTFAYTGGAERDRFRGTSAHNTVQVDDLHQAEPVGPFKWHSLPNVSIERWVMDDNFDLFAGSHDGYRRLPEPVRHRRHVFCLKSRFWLIHDLLEGAGVHKLDLFWHFGTGSLTATSAGAMFINDRQPALALLFATNQDYSREVIQDWHSPAYGKKEASSTLRISTRAQLPASFATLLAPVEEVTAHPGDFHPVLSSHSGVPVRSYRYSTPNGPTHQWFFADTPGDWQLGSWSSDAQFLYCSMCPDSILQQFTLCDGSHFEVDDRSQFAAQAAVPVTKLMSVEDARPTSDSEEAAVTFSSADFLMGKDTFASA